MEELSKRAEKLIVVIYKVYKKRVKDGIDESKAKWFDISDYSNVASVGKWKLDAINEISKELYRKNYVYCICGDGLVEKLNLLDNTIIYMENRLKHKITNKLKFLQLFKFW